jgi:hypothetical protein
MSVGKLFPQFVILLSEVVIHSNHNALFLFLWYLAQKLVNDETYASQIPSFEFVSRAFFFLSPL